MRKRMSIMRKLGLAYMALALPLAVILLKSYGDWYQSRIDHALIERRYVARSVGDDFANLVTALQRTMAVTSGCIAAGSSEYEVTQDLKALVSEYPLAYAVVTDSQGRVRFANDPKLKGRDLSAYPAVRQALATGKAGIEPAGGSGKSSGFHVTCSVSDAKGSRAGAVAAFVDVAKLHGVLTATVADGASISDPTGRVVFFAENAGYALERRVRDVDAWSHAAYLGQEKETAERVSPLTGTVRIAATGPIRSLPLVDGKYWVASAAVDREGVLAPIRATFTRSLVVTSLVGVLAFAFSITLARSITGSLRDLGRAARRMGRGDLDAQIEIRSGDEVEDAARALEKARVELKAAREALEETGRANAEIGRLNGALSDIDEQIHSTMRSDVIMQRVVERAGEALDAESAAIVVREPAGWRMAFVHGTMPEHLREGILTDEEFALGPLIARTKDIIVAADTSADARLASSAALASVKSAMALPLIVRSNFRGVMVFNNHSKRRTFSPAEIDFGKKLGAHVSLAMENAALYEAEHRVAETLQEALLVVPESVVGVEYACHYHSASNEARVGGDFYDLFELRHGLVGITVGDVSGKGLDAAVLTSRVKNIVRARAEQPGTTPADVLSAANALLVAQSAAETFVTVFFGILDCRDGRLAYANGGHTTGGIVSTDGRVRPLGSTGPLVGAFRDVSFGVGVRRLVPDDIVFLYTDGLIEARCGGGIFGEERLFETLARVRAEPLEQLVEQVVADARAYGGGKLNDDVAAMALRWAPEQVPMAQQKLRIEE